MNRRTLLLITIFTEGGIFLFGLLLLHFSQLDTWANFNISWWSTAAALLLCLPMLALLFFFERSTWEPIIRFRHEFDEKIVPIFANNKLPDLIVIALLAGVGEELFFRGWLQNFLIGKFDIWLGILIASAIFGFIHYLSGTYAIYAGLTGIYLGVIYQVSGNLYIVMAIHALYDLIALVYLLRRREREEARVQPME